MSSVRGHISCPPFMTEDTSDVSEPGSNAGSLECPGWHVVIDDVSLLGVGQADEAEMKLIASTPYRKHVYSADTFQAIRSVQRELISQVCAAVEDQLSSLVSGEEGETRWPRTSHTHLFKGFSD